MIWGSVRLTMPVLLGVVTTLLGVVTCDNPKVNCRLGTTRAMDINVNEMVSYVSYQRFSVWSIVFDGSGEEHWAF
jgi:hypothetical protein